MKNIDKLLLHRLLKGIADAIIKVFIPILIYKATGNIFYCFLNIVLDYLLTCIGFIVYKKVIQKNTKLSLILSSIPLIASEILLLICNIDILIVILIAVLDSIYTAFYYGSLNLLFLDTDTSSNTSKFETGQHIGKIIFTLLSAYLLGEVANTFVFMVSSSILLYILCIIPIILLKDDTNVVVHKKFNINEILNDNKYYNFYHIFTGVFSFICEFVLPLYLYINGLSFTVVGIFMALQYSINIIANYLAKFLSKKNLTKLTIIIGSSLLFVSLILILCFNSSFTIYILTLIITFAYQLLFISMFNEFIKDQKGKDMYKDSIFYRDVFQNSARVCIGSLYFILPNFFVLFCFGIVSSIGIGVFGVKIDYVNVKKDIED